MKKSHRRGILFPVLVSIISTLAVFAAAEYMFNLPSRLWDASSPSQDSRPSWDHVVRTSTGIPDEYEQTPATIWPTETSSGTADAPVNTGKTVAVDDTIICTLEYAPVCGADGKTYSNPCMANKYKTIVAHDGACEEGALSTQPKVDDSIVVTDLGVAFDTGSYLYYQNANYSLYLPKYVYYSGFGAQDGAAHTLGVALTATGVDSFDTTDVKVYFYRTVPANPPVGKEVSVANGVLYIDGDITNPKVTKILDTIGASAR